MPGQEQDDRLEITSRGELPSNLFEDDPTDAISEEETMAKKPKRVIHRSPNGQFAAEPDEDAMIEDTPGAETALVRREFGQLVQSASTEHPIEIRSDELPMAVRRQIAATLDAIGPDFRNSLNQIVNGQRQHDDQMTADIRNAIGLQLRLHASQDADSRIEYTDETVGALARSVDQELVRRAGNRIEYTDDTLNELFMTAGKDLAQRNFAIAQHTNNMVIGAYDDLSSQIALHTTAVIDRTTNMVVASHANLSNQIAQNMIDGFEHTRNLFTNSLVASSNQIARSTIATVGHTDEMFNSTFMALNGTISEKAREATALAHKLTGDTHKELTETIEEKARESRKENQDLRNELQNLKENYKALTDQIQNAPHQELTEKIAAREKESTNLKKELKNLKGNYKALAEEIQNVPHQELTEKIAAQEKESTDLKKELKTLKENYKALAEQDQNLPHQELTEKITAQEKESTDLKKELQDLKLNYKTLSDQIQNTTREEPTETIEEKERQREELYHDLKNDLEGRLYAELKDDFENRLENLTEQMKKMSSGAHNSANRDETPNTDRDETTSQSSRRNSLAPSLVESNGDTDMANDEIVDMLREENKELKSQLREYKDTIKDQSREIKKQGAKLDEMMEMLKQANQNTKSSRRVVQSIESDGDEGPSRRPPPARDKSKEWSAVPDSGSEAESSNLKPWQKEFEKNQREKREAGGNQNESSVKELAGGIVMNVEPGRETRAENAGLRRLAKGIYVCPQTMDIADVPDEFKQVSTKARIPLGSIILKADVGAIVEEQKASEDGSHEIKRKGGYYVGAPDVKAWVALPNLTARDLKKLPEECLPELPRGTIGLRKKVMTTLLNEGGVKDKADDYIKMKVQSGEHIWMDTLNPLKEQTDTRTFKGKETPVYSYYIEKGQDRTPFRTWDPEYRNRDRTYEGSPELERAGREKTRGNLNQREHLERGALMR